MGGDEFVLVLADLKPEALSEKLKRVEKLVLDAGIAVCREALVAISAGAAFIPPTAPTARAARGSRPPQYLTKQLHKSPQPDSAGSPASLRIALQ
jgi:hypothetical protein